MAPRPAGQPLDAESEAALRSMLAELGWPPETVDEYMDNRLTRPISGTKQPMRGEIPPEEGEAYRTLMRLIGRTEEEIEDSLPGAEPSPRMQRLRRRGRRTNFPDLRYVDG